MAGNTFGKIFSISTFGESHGAAIGLVLDGCIPNLEVDLDLIRADLKRRKPGQSAISTSRNEEDEFEIVSGVFEGKTLGTPICVLVRNKDARSEDYTALKDVFRPSHADFTYQAKYGIRDYRGGGRQSARETIARVIAGSFAKMILSKFGVQIQAYVSQVHTVKLSKPFQELDLVRTETNAVRCPDEETAKHMEEAILAAKAAGDTLGGIVSCVIKNVPIGLGEPVFDKLNADLAKAMFSINAVKGFDLGSGFDAVTMKGSNHNDALVKEGEKIHTSSNFSGGIQGGISNGENVYFRVAFKPVSSVAMEQESLNTSHEAVKFTIDGRHDPCVVPRAVPIVEAMAAIVLVDHFLRNAAQNLPSFA